MMLNVGKNSVRLLGSIPRCSKAVLSAGYHEKVRVCDPIFTYARDTGASRTTKKL